MILFSWSWPNEIELELHPGANTILCNLIVFPSDNGIKIVPISSVYITCFATVTRSKLLAFVFENSF